MTSAKRVIKPALRQFIERVASQDVEDFPEWDLEVTPQKQVSACTNTNILKCFGLTGATAEASGAGAFENAEQVPGHDGGGDACG